MTSINPEHLRSFYISLMEHPIVSRYFNGMYGEGASIKFTKILQSGIPIKLTPWQVEMFRTLRAPSLRTITSKL